MPAVYRFDPKWNTSSGTATCCSKSQSWEVRFGGASVHGRDRAGPFNFDAVPDAATVCRIGSSEEMTTAR